MTTTSYIPMTDLECNFYGWANIAERMEENYKRAYEEQDREGAEHYLNEWEQALRVRDYYRKNLTEAMVSNLKNGWLDIDDFETMMKEVY